MKTYSPKKVVVIWGGQPLTGYVDGSFVKVAQAGDAFTKYVGADGEVSRVASADESGQISVTLKQTSGSNDYLSSEHRTDRRLLTGGKPLIVEDTSGRTLHSCAEAWIVKMPDDEKGKEINGVEWVFDCEKLDSFIGGN